MALCMAAFASIAGPVTARLRPHRTVALGMVIMAAAGAVRPARCRRGMGS